ncbi:glycosyltransferase [Coleofasciculus sp. FACHB-SPT36]|uniref:glycosyltransferase family protein n=1 Tax=Cyanophyceae TaxID=3028117 RepID=UPI00168AA764|nr:glycosyltransferase [Coleofasciculus sp. FACHB-SPT36]MBD2538439.1 glycosyltransferase [Coleofasciculus sp. FACHB-SPT36]
MKHIVLMGEEKQDYIVDDKFKLSYFNPLKYLPFSEFANSSNLDFLWRNNSKNSGNIQLYKKLLEDFIERFAGVDIIIATFFNPFHPEWLIKNFLNTVKIYGCIDDPWAIYKRRINSLWAFDAAFYVSPSYDCGISMKDALAMWGVPINYWWPLSLYNKVSLEHCKEIQQSWTERMGGIIYVGNLYGSKFDRLVEFKRRTGKEFSIYGRWPLGGYAGFLGPIRGRKFFPYRVRSITNEQRRQLYLRHKICLNMHLSDYPRETGNMRMYEAPFHGLMLLCDKAADGWHESIFKPNVEAVFYDDIEDAVDKAKFYLKHDSAREKIARTGFERFCKDYDADKCLKLFLEWASSVQVKLPLLRNNLG